MHTQGMPTNAESAAIFRAPTFIVHFENIGFTDSRRVVDAQVTEMEAHGFSEVATQERQFPEGVLAVVGGYITEDDGQGKRNIKVFCRVKLPAFLLLSRLFIASRRPTLYATSTHEPGLSPATAPFFLRSNMTPVDHPAYIGALRLKGYRSPVTISQASTSSDAATVLTRLHPGWSKLEHVQLADFHFGQYKELMRRWSEVLNQAAMQTFGREYHISDYRISEIACEEFSEEHKAQLRTLIHTAQKHKDIADAHREAAKYRRAKSQCLPQLPKGGEGVVNQLTMRHYRSLCLWCMGDGPAYHGDYISSAEAWFKCLSCGQDMRTCKEHYAEGDYLEQVTAKGGYGVLFCSSRAGKLPHPYRLHVQWRPEERIYCYRLSGNAKVDEALAKRLIALSSWVMVTMYDRDGAVESDAKRFDLTSITRQDAVLHGTPPAYDKLIEMLLNGLGFGDEDDELYALLSTYSAAGRSTPRTCSGR